MISYLYYIFSPALSTYIKKTVCADNLTQTVFLIKSSSKFKFYPISRSAFFLNDLTCFKGKISYSQIRKEGKKEKFIKKNYINSKPWEIYTRDNNKAFDDLFSVFYDTLINISEELKKP